MQPIQCIRTISRQTKAVGEGEGKGGIKNSVLEVGGDRLADEGEVAAVNCGAAHVEEDVWVAYFLEGAEVSADFLLEIGGDFLFDEGDDDVFRAAGAEENIKVFLFSEEAADFDLVWRDEIGGGVEFVGRGGGGG